MQGEIAQASVLGGANAVFAAGSPPVPQFKVAELAAATAGPGAGNETGDGNLAYGQSSFRLCSPTGGASPWSPGSVRSPATHRNP